MPYPQTTPNFRRVRSLVIETFTPDPSPYAVEPPATEVLVDAKNGGTYNENSKGSTIFLCFSDGAGNCDFGASAIVAVWIRTTVVPDTVAATTNTWVLAVPAFTAQSRTYFNVPFRGDVYVQIKSITTTLTTGVIRVLAAPSLAGEGNLAALSTGSPETVKFPPFSYDSFGRVRVSEPFTLLDAKFLYDKQPLVYDEITAGGATGAGPGTSAMVNMTVTNAGDRIVRQTRKYATYQPGKSLFVLATGVLNTQGKVANSVARIGIFDDVNDKTFPGSYQNGNGFFVEQNGTALRIGKRSYVTGAQVDTIVEQANWNVDPMDGTGPSGLTLDITKSQIFFWDFEWLGVGTVRQGVIINETYYFIHYWNHANIINTMYSQTMTLPVRYELTASGAGASGPFVLKQGCVSVASEAGFNPRGQVFTADRDTRSRSIGTATFTPLVSVRLRKEQNRGVILPLSIDLMATGTNDQGRFALIYGIAGQNPIVLSGATFAGVSGSNCEYDMIASAMSGGYLISSGYFSSNARTISVDLSDDVVASSNIRGEPDIVTLAAQGITGTITALGSLTWQEYY